MSDIVKISAKTPEVNKETKIAPKQNTHFSRSTNSPADHILFLQRTIGNQSIQRLIKSGTIRTKLRTGAPGDILGQEAARVAEHVRLNRQPLEKEEDVELKRKPANDNYSKTLSDERFPRKSISEEPEMEEESKPSPYNGSATIKCDGNGGYEIVYNGWDSATCGTKDCVTTHENSHISDWKAKWPTGCNGQAKGYLPKGDPPDNPLMTVPEYNVFLKDSECKAHKADLKCAKSLPKPNGCKNIVEDYIKLTETQKKKWC
jgi:hypothetical protein